MYVSLLERVGVSSESKRDLIISASVRVFPRLGFHAATVDDILREAGVARSTFYTYFSNKREAYNEAVRVTIDWVVQATTSGIDDLIARFDVPAGQWPEDVALENAIADLMINVYTYLSENSGMAQMFLNELVGIDDEMTSFFIDFEDRLTHQFARLVRFGRKIGLIRELDDHRIANFIVCGLIHLGWKVSAGQHTDEIEEISRQFVAFHMRGLLNRTAFMATTEAGADGLGREAQAARKV